MAYNKGILDNITMYRCLDEPELNKRINSHHETSFAHTFYSMTNTTQNMTKLFFRRQGYEAIV